MQRLTDEEAKKWRQNQCSECSDYIEHPLSIVSDNPCRATDEEIERCMIKMAYERSFGEEYRYFHEWVKEEGERCIEEGLIPQEEVN